MSSYFIIQMYYNRSNWNWQVFQWLPILNSAIVSVHVHVSWLYIGIFFFWLNQHMFFKLFLKFIFNRTMVALQCCIGFCHTITWISHSVHISPPS